MFIVDVHPRLLPPDEAKRENSIDEDADAAAAAVGCVPASKRKGGREREGKRERDKLATPKPEAGTGRPRPASPIRNLGRRENAWPASVLTDDGFQADALT